MIGVSVNTKRFQKEMNNIVDYSLGFLDGVQQGKKVMFKNLGPEIVEFAYQYVDSNARITPQMLHHVYEWHETGSPKARLFNIESIVKSSGISFATSFKQSKTIKDGSRTPFYNKASIMENGVNVRIEPKRAETLRFEIDGEVVYTKKPITISNPGGVTKGQFEKVINSFFGLYFKQSFLRASGLSDYFKNARVFKDGIKRGKFAGHAEGIKVGYRWTANAGVRK